MTLADFFDQALNFRLNPRQVTKEFIATSPCEGLCVMPSHPLLDN